jgi:hypothetical protein
MRDLGIWFCGGALALWRLGMPMLWLCLFQLPFEPAWFYSGINFAPRTSKINCHSAMDCRAPTPPSRGTPSRQQAARGENPLSSDSGAALGKFS